MRENLLEMKKLIILGVILVFSYWILNNIDKIFNILKGIYMLLEPFILGGILAFILNVLVNKIEYILEKITKRNKPRLFRVISIIVSLIIFMGLIIFMAFLLIPELIYNIELLAKNVPDMMKTLEEYILRLFDKYPSIQEEINEMFLDTVNISTIVGNVLNYVVMKGLLFIETLVSSFVTIFMALIFAIYMLFQKEYLINNSKKVVYALFNKKQARWIIDLFKLINNTFNKFITGQCLEAIILGVLMFGAFKISGIPYALMIAVLTGITSLVPIFGAFVAMIIGGVLIVINDLGKVIVFIVVFQIVQQIEGNLIYPRVVGASVGLKPLWTLLAVSVGGSLFGIFGILMGLPVASIIYVLFRDFVSDRLNRKRIKI